MSRINGPVWKTSRRLGFSILETGEELQKRAYAPGQHGPTKRVKLTNYGQQLREKQKIIGQILWKNDEIGLCVSGTHAGSGAGDLTFCDEGTNLLGRHCCIIHVKKPPLI